MGVSPKTTAFNTDPARNMRPQCVIRLPMCWQGSRASVAPMEPGIQLFSTDGDGKETNETSRCKPGISF